MTARYEDAKQLAGMSQSGRSPSVTGGERPDLQSRRRVMLPSMYWRCRWRYCWFAKLSGFSCKHQLYAAILYESGMPYRLAFNVAQKRRNIR